MKFNKSQAAMEFLMTYGWALLVVLIAIAALAFFGMLNPSRFLPERCELTPGLLCVGYNALTNNTDVSEGDDLDNITLIIQNLLPNNLNNFTIYATDCNNEDEANYTIDTFITDTTRTVIIPCKGMSPNSRFRTNLLIRYSETVEGVTLYKSIKGMLVIDVGYYNGNEIE
jgi:uncharacterized protein (UPF0333 family)